MSYGVGGGGPPKRVGAVRLVGEEERVVNG